MSVTFAPAAADERPARCSCDDDVEPFSCPACRARLNVNELRGAELLAHVGLPAGNGGRERASRVAKLCEARLARLAIEPGYPATAISQRATLGGREPGHLRDLTAQLLEVARAGGAGDVVWW